MKEAEVPMDAYLKSYTDKYAKWRKSGTFTYSSKVIPVQESFEAQQWVLPREQVLQVLSEARTFVLTDCLCRTHYGRCDKPRDVCFLIDDLAEKAILRGKARRVSLVEASNRLLVADEHGLIHLALFMPGHRIYALCSCCDCCCHDLQLLKMYGRKDLVARSDYVAVTDPGHCTSCGLCVGRCVFSARAMQDGKFVYDAKACLGCGLCVSSCPEHATVMRQR